MLANYVTKEAIVVNEKLRNWKEVVLLSGQLLEDTNKIKKSYKQAMIENIKTHGPYIVIASGLAIPHARPKDGVKENGVSILTLQEPVQFGHPKYDPVDIIVSFAALDDSKHTELMDQLAEFLSYKQNLEQLRAAKDKKEVLSLIKV